MSIGRNNGGSIGVDLAGLGVLLFTIALFGVGVIVPATSARDTHRQAQQQFEADRAEVKSLRERQIELQNELNRLQESLKATRVEVESVSKLNARISRLTASATKRGLTLDRVAPEAPQRAPKATIVPIKIAGRGTFLSGRDWIADLRAEFPDVAVSGFEFTRDKASEADSASFSFDLAWHAAPSAQTAPKK